MFDFRAFQSHVDPAGLYSFLEKLKNENFVLWKRNLKKFILRPKICTVNYCNKISGEIIERRNLC